jgi:hypothetical protein
LRSQTVEEFLLKSCQIIANCSRKKCMRVMYISKMERDVKPRFSALLVALACSLIFISTAIAQSGSVYVDTQQHFTIQVPSGWETKPYNTGGDSGVTFVHGADAYVQISLQKGIDPAAFLNTLRNGIRTTHPGYHVLYQGMRTVAGKSGTFIVGESAETPSAARTRIYVETFAANGFCYAVIASAFGKNPPGNDLMADYKVSQEMIQSLTVNGVPAKTSAATIPPMTLSPAAFGSGATGNSSLLLSPKDKKKLAALDAAMKGGAVSEEEYQTKKIAFYSSALLRQKNSILLKALNQAYEDGVLTKDEYRRKKKALGAGVPPPSTPQDLIPDSGTPPPKPMEVFASKSDPQPEPLPKSWTMHVDPSGFEVSLPDAWTIDKVSSSGQIVLHGARGEEILIWPLHLRQPELEAQGGAAMVQELARKFDALMPWSAVQTTPNVARVMGLGAERSATAVLSWTNGPSAASVYFYGIRAPREIYRDSTDSFVAILKSFHVVQYSSIKDAPGNANGSGAGEPNFVNWNDPHEGAFRVSVPEGWQVIGGAYRLSTEDARYSVVMASPDGRVRASMGDSMVGAFTQPTQALAMAGLGEGTYQTLGDGSRLEILGYNSGRQFARSYVETLVSRQCSTPQIRSNNDREDLAAKFSQSAANEGFTDELLTAGEASFTCNLDGRPVKGKYIAATIRMAPSISSMWFVYRLYGYIAFAGREQDGEKVLAQMIQSSKFNPDWEARQKDAANAAAPRDDENFQQIRERAHQNIAEDQRQTTEMIANANERRQRIYAQIDRKRENSIVGRLDVVDPETGTQYEISGFGDYHYLSNDGCLYSANSPGEAGPTLREMIALH